MKACWRVLGEYFGWAALFTFTVLTRSTAVTLLRATKNFDAWLRTQNAQWGVRDSTDVADLAARNGFVLIETVPMPANNLSIIFKRDG